MSNIRYSILITYTTRVNNHFETVKESLELTWQDINIAKNNLKRIKEHYTMYKELEKQIKY